MQCTSPGTRDPAETVALCHCATVRETEIESSGW